METKMVSITMDQQPMSRNRHVMFLMGITALLIIQVLAPTASAQAPSQIAPEVVLQTGHTASVNTIAVSPDGRFLVSGSTDNSLKVWDLASGNVLRTLYGHTGAVLTAAISRDGRLIASGGQDATVRVWNVAT